MDFDERFFSKVRMTDDCWLWLGYRNPKGYGQFWDGSGMAKAHRLAYESAVGSIPEGWEIDHLCGNPSCVRPDHLEAVTPRENWLRSDAPSAHYLQRKRCHKGHEFDHVRVRQINGRTRRERVCLTCARERAADARKRRSAS